MRLEVAAIGVEVGEAERGEPAPDPAADLTAHLAKALPAQAQPGQRPAQELHTGLVAGDGAAYRARRSSVRRLAIGSRIVLGMKRL